MVNYEYIVEPFLSCKNSISADLQGIATLLKLSFTLREHTKNLL